MAKTRKKPENSWGEESAHAGGTAVEDRERVAVRAYELYVARGCGEGQDLDDWLSAERELNGASNTQGQTSNDRDRDES
jgi:hypothetical protein